MIYTILYRDAYDVVTFRFKGTLYVMPIKLFVNYINWRVDIDKDVTIYDRDGVLDEA